jgi:hypothetical protein
MSLISTDKFISEGNVRIDKVQKSNEEYKALKNNIKNIGLIQPITYRVNENGDFVVIDGHQRLQIHKDLKLAEIKAYESNGEVDDLTKQLSANMFTVPMSHLDASFAIDQMVEKGIVTTKKALKAKFGKSSEWVDVALAFCNIHPLIREYFKENTLFDETKGTLIIISKSTVTQQEIEIENIMADFLSDSINYDNVSQLEQSDFNDFVADYAYYEDGMDDFLDDLAKNLETDENKWEFICKVIGKETFREYETSHDVTHEYQNTLFQEYADTQWCQENSFLAEVFLAETPIGHFILEKDLPYTEERDYNGLRFDFGTSVATLKKNLKAEAGVGLKSISIDGWSGSVFNPRLSYTILEESQEPESYVDEHGKEDSYDENTDKETDRDLHWLKYNKFNKVAAPVIEIYLLDHIDTSIKNADKINMTFEWIMNTLDIMTDFSVGWNEEDNHPLNKWFNGEESLSNDDIIQKMANHWFIKHYASADFEQLDVLLKTQGLKSCKEILKDTYDSEKEEMGSLDGMVFRKAYLSVLSKAELVELEGSQDAKTMTKSNLVQLIANQEQDELPFFDLVCTNLGSGSNHLGGYLK